VQINKFGKGFQRIRVVNQRTARGKKRRGIICPEKDNYSRAGGRKSNKEPF
jgi:hypothetical protein